MTSYIPKNEEELNYSRENPLKEFSILLAGTLAVLLISYLILGFIGESLATRLSPEKELKYFSNLFSLSRFSAESDLRLESFNKLLMAYDEKNAKNLRIIKIKDSQLNAFAYPGGVIMVTEGLLEKVKGEIGLAFVIAHEIGHFHHRDHLKGLGRSLGFTLLGSMVGLSGESFVVNDLAANLIDKSYSRIQESSADDFAISILQKVYGNTKGAEEFFDVILREHPISSQLIPSILSTHPNSEERRDRIANLADLKK